MRTKKEYQEAFNDIVYNGISCEYFNIKTELKQTANPIFIIQELIDNLKENDEK